MAKSRLLAALLVASAALLAPASASATFHLMQIREVFPGTSAAGHDDAFVELQMYAAGQNLVGGHALTVYDSSGTPTSHAFAGNVTNSANQSTILIGDTAVAGADLSFPELSSLLTDPGGGAVCWETIDCMSYRGGPGAAVLPSPAGTPIGNPPTDGTWRRKISAGCPTALDTVDDTNNTADFEGLMSADPRPNSQAPTEKLCAGTNNGNGGGANAAGNPDTKISKVKVIGSKATVRFTGSDDNPGKVSFKCRLDRGKFRKCASPKTYKHLRPGRHKVKVEAIDSEGNVDPSPAKKSFSV